MVKNEWKSAFITLLVVTIGGGVLFALFSTSNPILYINPLNFPAEHCLVNGFSEGDEYAIYLSNKAETPASSEVCFSGDNLVFQVNNQNYSGKFCYGERVVNPKSSDLVQIYSPRIYLNDSIRNKNFNITMSISCQYSVLSVIPRSCGAMIVTCNYKDNNNRISYIR